LTLLISKNDKNLVFQGLKTLLEETFEEVLVIKNYEDLHNYNLPLFPTEAVVLYYDPSMNNHNKYHHLINNSKYVIIITEFSWSYENELIIPLGFNGTCIPWFFNKTINYFKHKYQLDFSISDDEKKIAIKWIISHKYDPLQFCKNLFFIKNLNETIDYVQSITHNLKTIKNKTYATPFMEFYRLMMANYGGKTTVDGETLLGYMVLFNELYG
jgi:hypothetical protein